MLLKQHIGRTSKLNELGEFFFRNQTDSTVLKAISVLEQEEKEAADKEATEEKEEI